VVKPSKRLPTLPRRPLGDESAQIPVGRLGEASDRSPDRGRIPDRQRGRKNAGNLAARTIANQRSYGGDRVLSERSFEGKARVERVEVLRELGRGLMSSGHGRWTIRRDLPLPRPSVPRAYRSLLVRSRFGRSVTTVEFVEGIDRGWLVKAAQREPVTHAYAVWDLQQTPEQVHFVSCRRGLETLAYLLIWNGGSRGPVVHWVGDEAEATPLVDRLPPRPLMAFVPAELTPLVVARRGPATSETILTLHRPWSAETPRQTAPLTRRLRRSDHSALASFLQRFPDPLAQSYASLDPEMEPTWGAFSPETGALEGVAKTSARLPRLWVITGVFVAPGARGRGLGTALTAGLVRDALAAHADSALYVREANLAARRAYEKVGFQFLRRRMMVDAGVGQLASAP
jgi:ribosomal protein S18 acetylase RimI-like enzyme